MRGRSCWRRLLTIRFVNSGVARWIRAARGGQMQPVLCISFWHTAYLKLLIRFAHRTPLARSEDSSGSAGRRLSIHAVDCRRLLPCCGTVHSAECRAPPSGACIVSSCRIHRANDAAERSLQAIGVSCSGTALQHAASTRQDGSAAPRPRRSTSRSRSENRDEAQALQEVQMLWTQGSRAPFAVLRTSRYRCMPRRCQ